MITASSMLLTDSLSALVTEGKLSGTWTKALEVWDSPVLAFAFRCMWVLAGARRETERQGAGRNRRRQNDLETSGTWLFKTQKPYSLPGHCREHFRWGFFPEGRLGKCWSLIFSLRAGEWGAFCGQAAVWTRRKTWISRRLLPDG